MARIFNTNGLTVQNNQGNQMVAFDGAFVPAINFGLRIIIPNQQALQSVKVEFTLHEIRNNRVGPPISDIQTLLSPLGAGNQYTPSAQYLNHQNYYVTRVDVTPQVNLNGQVQITTQCYHL